MEVKFITNMSIEIVQKVEKKILSGNFQNAENGEIIMNQLFYLGPNTILQTHLHTGMDEHVGLVEGDRVLLYIQNGNNKAKRIELINGQTILIKANVKHTIVNPSKEKATLAAIGVKRRKNGVTEMLNTENLAITDSYWRLIADIDPYVAEENFNNYMESFSPLNSDRI